MWDAGRKEGWLERVMANSWEILGVSPDSSESEIKHAFRQKAFEVHPDVGGNAEEFRKLYAAYEECLHRVAPCAEINLDEMFSGFPSLLVILKAMCVDSYLDSLNGLEDLIGTRVHFTFGGKPSPRAAKPKEIGEGDNSQ